MKKLITILIMAASFVAVADAQDTEFAEFKNNILYLKNGTALSKGDIVMFGTATGCYENCFEYIFKEPAEMIPQLTNKFTENVYAVYSGEKVIIKKIKQISKNKQKIWLVSLDYPIRKETFYCYLEQAFNAGEIVLSGKPNILSTDNSRNQSKQAQPAQKQQSNDSSKQGFSVADEIRKLKSLLDEGIITKEEFEKQKTKLLE